MYRDNVLNYLAARHVGSTKLNGFTAGYTHALSEGERVQGLNKKISLAEARKMATDLVDDFFILRKKFPPRAPVSLPTAADIQGALASAVLAMTPTGTHAGTTASTSPSPHCQTRTRSARR